MNTRDALTLALDLTERWVENQEEYLAIRDGAINANTTDTQLNEWFAGEDIDLDAAKEYRDALATVERLTAILNQKGVEHLDPAAVDAGGDAHLTTLIDIVIDG